MAKEIYEMNIAARDTFSQSWHSKDSIESSLRLEQKVIIFINVDIFLEAFRCLCEKWLNSGGIDTNPFIKSITPTIIMTSRVGFRPIFHIDSERNKSHLDSSVRSDSLFLDV